MEFMGFHIVDIVIIGLVALLAIKGLVNGFTKELLNFITIVSGVILAARYNEIVVKLINEQKLVPPIPDEFAKIIGFLLIIVSIWLFISFISSIITKRPSGFLSRLFGYILSSARYLFIFSLIIFGVSQSNFFKESATKFKAETKLFEPMSQIGAKILNIDLNQTRVAKNHSIQSKESNLTEVMLSKTTNTEVNVTAKPSNRSVEDNASN